MSRLLSTLLGIFVALFYLINTVIWSLLVWIIAIPLLFIPCKKWRLQWHKFMNSLPNYWTMTNGWFMHLTSRIEWDIQGMEGLQPDKWYLMIANHQTWTDILVLQYLFAFKIPSLRFFMKRSLLWQLPIVAQTCWLLNFPFMHRYRRSYLKKHPEMKGKDVETTRKICAKFKDIPITMINFIEGRRFSKKRHFHQQSPFKYLLKPKAGGMAFTLMTMGKNIHTVLDVTLVYGKDKATIWDFFSGRIPKISVRVRAYPVTDEILGDYENDREYRARFQTWLNQIWSEKDRMIKEIKKA